MWTDINDALAESSRGRPGQRFSQTRVRDALRRAARSRPDWFRIRPADQGEQGEEITQLAPFGIQPRTRTPAEEMMDGRGLEPDEELVGYAEDEGTVLGDRGATTLTPQQESDLQRRARNAMRELEAAIRHAREAARTEATEAGRALATATENGLTAILRPMSLAFATATGPAQRGAGLGLGLGLVLLVAFFAK